MAVLEVFVGEIEVFSGFSRFEPVELFLVGEFLTGEGLVGEIFRVFPLAEEDFLEDFVGEGFLDLPEEDFLKDFVEGDFLDFREVDILLLDFREVGFWEVDFPAESFVS